MKKFTRIVVAAAIAGASLAAGSQAADAGFKLRIGVPKEIKCAAKCKSRTGFGACYGVCLATKLVCDSGHRNCSKL
jgi:hypothetical protein